MTVRNVEAAKQRYAHEMVDFTLRKWNGLRLQQEQAAAQRALAAPAYAFAGDIREDADPARGRTATRAGPLLSMTGMDES